MGAGDEGAGAAATGSPTTSSPTIDPIEIHDPRVAEPDEPIPSQRRSSTHIDGPAIARYGFPAGMHAAREALVLSSIVGVALVLVYRLWRADLGVPFTYSGDGLVNLSLVQAVREQGWYLTNPRLGAPFGGQLYDFPLGGENLHALVMKGISLFTPTAAWTLNLYFLSTFFLVALSAYFVARYLRLAVLPALVVGVLYTFLPFHLFHGEDQVTRSGYYVVPLAVLLLLWVLDYRTRFLDGASEQSPVGALRWRPLLAAVAIAVVLGASDTQNTIFAASLLGVVAVSAALAGRDWRPLVLAGVLVAASVGTLVLNNLPTLRYQAQRGANEVAGKRTLLDQEVYALRLSKLVLPVRDHRVRALADLEREAREGDLVPNEDGQALGLVAAVGFLAGLGMVFARALGASRRRPGALEPLAVRFGALELAAVVIASVGGFSYLFALGGLMQQRTWNRITVFIAFLALLTVGLFLQWLTVTRARRRPGLAVGVLAIVLVVGVLDQTTDGAVPDYARIAAKYRTDAEFYGALERRLPRGATVFQFPVVRFPESPPVVGMLDYEELTAYLQSKELRWSYGAMKGRPEGDWQLSLARLPAGAAASSLAAAGFRGLVLDRTGYEDRGSALEAAWSGLLGPPRLASTDDRLVYFDLSGLRARLSEQLGSSQLRALGRVTLHPVNPVFRDGFHGEDAVGRPLVRWSGRSSVLELQNLDTRRVPVRITATIGGNPGTLTIRGLGARRDLEVVGTGTRWAVTTSLEPGATRLSFRSDAAPTRAPGESRQLVFSVNDLRVTRRDAPASDPSVDSVTG